MHHFLFFHTKFVTVFVSFQGDYENCDKHLTNAIAVCGQPQQLLQVFQGMLPPPVFQMLLQNLAKIGTSPQVCWGFWCLLCVPNLNQGVAISLGCSGGEPQHINWFKMVYTRLAWFKPPTPKWCPVQSLCLKYHKMSNVNAQYNIIRMPI